jgi:hypothetical protein
MEPRLGQRLFNKKKKRASRPTRTNNVRAFSQDAPPRLLADFKEIVQQSSAHKMAFLKQLLERNTRTQCKMSFFLGQVQMQRRMLLAVAGRVGRKRRFSLMHFSFYSSAVAACNIVLLFVIQKHRLRALHPLFIVVRRVGVVFVRAFICAKNLVRTAAPL